MRKNVVAPISFVVSLAAAGLASAANVEVTASALNLRSGPGTGYRVIAVAQRGEVMQALGTTGSWTLVQRGSTRAYGATSYLRTSSANTGTNTGTTSGTQMEVTASGLNVRSGPGTGYRVVGTLNRGARVTVTGQSGAWRRIAFNGGSAYVHGDYLGAVGSGSSSGGSTGSGWTVPGGRVSRAGYIQLPTSGPDFYGYYTPTRRWGKPAMVYGIERVSRRFRSEDSSRPRIGVGDISYENGGQISGHASHRLGVDADIRPVRNDRQEAAVTRFQSGYSRTLTRRALELFEAELRVTHIFFNDAAIRTAHRQNWPNHDNHFHVRIR
ncbi:MAG: penicillin-insensitive murein endopeptidase [Planctomycetota bacterium]